MGRTGGQGRTGKAASDALGRLAPLRGSIAAVLLVALVACDRPPPPPVVAPSLLEIELLATDPPQPALLAVGDTLYLRLSYRSDQPVRIQARGLGDGEPRPGGFNSSPAWPAADAGEAVAWFFVSEAGSIDAARVQVGDAAGRGTFREFDLPLSADFVAGAPAARQPEPWVAALRQRSEALAAAQNSPLEDGPGDLLLGGPIIALIFALLALAAALPLWAAIRWSPPWRWGALLAAAIFVLPVLNVIVGVSRDPTSHNLWPLELIGSALTSLALLTLLAWLRRRRA